MAKKKTKAKKKKASASRKQGWNRRLVQWDSRHLGWLLRVTERKYKGTRAKRLLIKCGDCDHSIEIIVEPGHLEINGVHASRHEWRRVLGPILRPSS